MYSDPIAFRRLQSIIDGTIVISEGKKSVISAPERYRASADENIPGVCIYHQHHPVSLASRAALTVSSFLFVCRHL